MNGIAHSTNRPEGKQKRAHNRKPGAARRHRALREKRRRRRDRRTLLARWRS